METFFVISSGVSWSDIMYQALKTRGIDLVLSKDIENPSVAIFFVILIVIGNFFLIN